MTLLQKTTMATLASLSNDEKLAIMEVPDVLTIDTEGLKTMLGFSVACDGLQEGFYLPFNHNKGNLTPKQQAFVFRLLAKKTLVFHNAFHDIRVLHRAGLTARFPFYCTLLMSHWLNENQLNFSLDALSKSVGGKPKEMPDAMKRMIESDGWDIVPVSLMDVYSSNDAFITHQLFRKKLPEFQAQGFDGPLWEVEQDFIRDVMGPMRDLGIKTDVEFCVREYMRGAAIMEEAITELGFKPTSPKALEKFLITDLKLPVVKHTKACKKCYPEDRRMQSVGVDTHIAKPSFDKDAMEIYEDLLDKKDDDRAKTILRYRGWLKTNSSNYKPYMNLVDDSFVLHPGYKLHGTKTGRLSCAEPNLQQIPKASNKDWNGNLKRAFVARPGFDLWTVDYSQLQFRMTCSYANQVDLIDIFNDAARDIFSEMASQMGWVRDDVKTLVYLILFGGGAKRAAVAFGVSVTQGKELVEEFHAQYPNIRKIANQAQRAAQKQGYVAYWTGRRRHFTRGSAFYRAFNAVIQGGEAEIMKRAMIRLAKEVCDSNCRMVLQIHDEIAFEIRTGMADRYLPLIQKVMEEVPVDFCKYTGNHVKFKTSTKPWGEK